MSVGERRWPLRVVDDCGREHAGRLVLAHRWRPELGRPAADEEFRIVVLTSPTQDVHAEGPTVVCLPTAAPWGERVAEAAPTYATDAGPLLDASLLQRLRRGRFVCGLPLRLSPEQVFGHGEARWQLLALELVGLGQDLRLWEGAAQPLWAPADPPRDAALIRQRLEETLRQADAALSAGLAPELEEAASRLRQWLAGARPYGGPRELAQDVWAMRALAERPQEALEVARMRRFLAEAVAPDPGLELDRTLAREQLSYGMLALEPRRLAAARAAFAAFVSHYRAAYDGFHRSYQQEVMRARERLLAAATSVRSLRLLGTLTELGPPVGQRAAARWETLVRELTPCSAEAPAMQEGEARCRRCGLAMDATSPSLPVDECIRRLEGALGRQMARLARALVSDALSAQPAPALQGLLRALQASQVAPLVEVLDEKVVGQVRRALAEAGVHRALAPILVALQEGRAPDQRELARALGEVRRVLERSARALRGGAL
ncbi:MAG TPA: hypothetical protein VNL95_03260 [Dehalococcoidia bacterium]|nr:hypothetical protein [Dehalococcoidia bacterium]